MQRESNCVVTLLMNVCIEKFSWRFLPHKQVNSFSILSKTLQVSHLTDYLGAASGCLCMNHGDRVKFQKCSVLSRFNFRKV